MTVPTKQATDTGHAHSSTDSPEHLAVSARKYFGTAFPNPERDGCPREDDLLGCIRTGGMPNDELRQHLFSCSPCFAHYRYEFLAHTQRAAPVLLSRRASLMQRLRLFWWVPVFALLLLGIGIPSLNYLLRDQSREVNTAPVVKQINEPAELTPSTKSESEHPESPMAQITRKEVKPAPETSFARSRVEIDLDTAGLLRGVHEAEGTAEPAAQVARSLVALSIKLPRNSAAGKYKVSLVDAYGKPVGPSRSVRSDGRSINTALDLGGVRLGRYRLVISHGRDVPDYFPIEIINGPRQPRP